MSVNKLNDAGGYSTWWELGERVVIIKNEKCVMFIIAISLSSSRSFPSE